MSTNPAMTRWLSSTITALLLFSALTSDPTRAAAAAPGFASHHAERDERRHLDDLRQLLLRSAQQANVAVQVVRRGRKLLVKPLGPPRQSLATVKRRVLIDGVLEIAAQRDDIADSRGRFGQRARQQQQARAHAARVDVRARQHAERALAQQQRAVQDGGSAAAKARAARTRGARSAS
ncbi:MAG: hypothetical protein KC503_37875 [Myxococcales bacterium]|nr:hypothetical protein [Myxococcales bacterium]